MRTAIAPLLLTAVAALADDGQRPRRDYLEEVLVTAQKRAESIQEVPLAVTALSAERISASGMESFEDVALATPNADINLTAGYVQVGMRGRNAPINDGMEQSVGFYVDGVYYGKTAFLQDAFLDLERVEMLKGPQGTLFGKNTIAGAINVTSARPDDEWQLKAKAGGGDFDNRLAEAVVNVPLIEERLAARIAAVRHQREGYVHNVLRDADEKQIDKTGLRAKLLINATDRLDLVLSAYRGESRDNGQGWEPFVLQDDARTTHGAFNPALEARFNYVGHANTDNFSAVETRFLNLEANWELGGWFEEHQLVMIASTAELEERFLLDADTASAPIADWLNDDEYQQEMLELRLMSPPGKLEYIFGLFQWHSDYLGQSSLNLFPEDRGAASAGGLLLPPPLAQLLIPIVGPLDPLFTPLLADALHQRFEQDTLTRAAFGQLSWYISDRLSLILGLRASSETKEVDVRQQYENSGVLLQAFFGVEPYRLQDNRDESNIAPKLSFKYQPSDDHMLYASYSEGFKAGGFNPMARNEGEAVFEQETALSYELGYKLTAQDGALTVNTALFHSEFSDMQIQSFIGNGFIVRNAAEATTEGLELEVNWQPWRGSSFYLGAGYTKATFDEFREGPCRADQSSAAIGSGETCDLTGASLPRVPKKNVSAGFNSAIPLWDERLALVIGADVSWRSEVLLELDQDPIDSMPAHHVVNARLGLAHPDQRWHLVVHGKNLGDRKVRRFAADLPVFNGSHMGFLAPPRTVVAELGVAF